jgi:hypothetical protein
MKCLNPACESIAAEEFNVSLNTSETDVSAKTEYIGNTEYGDCSDGIGTWCNDCGEITFRSDWLQITRAWVEQQTLTLTPEQDPWTSLCTKCHNNKVPTYGMECLECES